jgi:hypothetical protein
METVISSCAEAAGTEISKAAVETMIRYSNRFKAPPCCFRRCPMKGACTFPDREQPATTITSILTYRRFWLVCLPARSCCVWNQSNSSATIRQSKLSGDRGPMYQRTSARDTGRNQVRRIPINIVVPDEMTDQSIRRQ